MFYILNNQKAKSGKKNSYNPYKQIVKELVEDICSIDLDKLVIVNTLIPERRIESLEELAFWIKDNHETLSYKEIEKKLKALYSEVGFEKLLFSYICNLNTSLTEDFILNASRKNKLHTGDILENYEEFKVRRKARTVMVCICLYAILISEDLLNKQIHRFEIKDNYLESRIIKETRTENLSLLKGIDNTPILLTQKETELLHSLLIKFHHEGQPIALFEHIRLIYSHRFLEHLISLLCFGSDFNKMFTPREFIGEEGYRIQDTKFYPVPFEVPAYRRFIPSDDGVVLKTINHPKIESLFVNECTRFDVRFIYGIVRFKDGFEQTYSVRMNDNPFSICFAVHSPDIVSILTDFYQVPSNIADTMQGLVETPKYDILPSTCWNYRTKGYILPTDNSSNGEVFKNTKPKFTTYVRKTKGNASTETIEFAKRLKLKLFENETLVKERDRGYNRF